MTYSGSKVKLISLTVVGAGFFSSQSCSVTPTEFFLGKCLWEDLHFTFQPIDFRALYLEHHVTC